MAAIREAIVVHVPVRVAYGQWTRFEEFPRFMEGVKEVRQIDDGNLHWEADVAGRHAEWDAEIVEQVPDSRIAWRSTEGTQNDGDVTFESVDEGSTRVAVVITHEDEGLVEKAGTRSAWPSAACAATSSASRTWRSRAAVTRTAAGVARSATVMRATARRATTPVTVTPSTTTTRASGPRATPRAPGSRRSRGCGAWRRARPTARRWARSRTSTSTPRPDTCATWRSRPAGSAGRTWCRSTT